MTSALVVHGHFYQPPRENPWTDEVEVEPSAAPYHDWNERVSAECYARNAFARRFDHLARIEHIGNSYARMSFNFGPTLLRWLERHDRATYARILAGDRASAAAQGGHGNAIAQAYNHMIMPIAHPRDRATQIRWGIADFEHHFHRKPEGMWLPETGVDRATLGNLIDADVRFTILSPHQAERVRPADCNLPWRDVSGGSIDPTRPYRFLHPDGSGRSIALFFYDGPIAADVSFGRALSSSQSFVDRFLGAHRPGREHLEVLHIATDGETYGHHKPMADLSLAHALEFEAHRRGLRVTNYGAILEEAPPRWEADIRPGPDGQGTAWSCAHGLGRWSRDCGCHSGSHPEWNQKWRAPLRRALDVVRDHVAPLFAGSALMPNAWEARDAYIEIVLDPRPERRHQFLEAHARVSRPAEEVEALKLLEMQRHAMLMYTSCGWFFDDIAGLEAVQVLKYAGRVIDLCEQLGMPSPREAFLDVLTTARANLATAGTGADVFRDNVEPLRVTPERVVCQLAFSSLVKDVPPEGQLAGYRYRTSDLRLARNEPLSLVTGAVQLEQTTVGSMHDLEFAALHLGSVDFTCGVRRAGEVPLAQSAQTLLSLFPKAALPRLLRALDHAFGDAELGLDHVLPDARQEILGAVFQEVVDRFAHAYARLHDDNSRTFDILRAAGYRLPPLVRVAGELTLGGRFEHEIEVLCGVCDLKQYREARRLASEIAALGYQVDTKRAASALEATIEQQIQRLTTGTAAEMAEALQGAARVVRMAADLRVKLDLTRAQNLLYPVLAALYRDPANVPLVVELGFAPPVDPTR